MKGADFAYQDKSVIWAAVQGHWINGTLIRTIPGHVVRVRGWLLAAGHVAPTAALQAAALLGWDGKP